MTSDLRVARVLAGTTSEGPGRRTAVSVQGCSIRCHSCINPQLFDSRGGELVDAREIVMRAIRSGDEGITLIGGEPFDQPEGILALARIAVENDLGVICFTGYRIEELRERRSEEPSALDYIDLLVDGPFERRNPDPSRSLVGSTNQRFIHLTDRYCGFDPGRALNRVDVRISSAGEVEVAGFMSHERLDGLAELLNATRRQRGRLRR